ncbi:hypothetical protein DH2020_035394 [Rehmannia glutinosa]|uniref:Uncharacterized protein n=1 Tax=Rehmannia glutinosa TaxID=99300 RepID=A0ABR0V990_REHGL
MEVTMAEPGEILPERNVDMTTLYDMLRQSKASAEEIVAKMLAIKKEAQPKSQLRELVTQTLLNFVTLRLGKIHVNKYVVNLISLDKLTQFRMLLKQANRSILLEEDRVKAETERAKAPVDLTTLQLHNLMYEKNHYVKAIKACKDFKTKYPDIELVPEDEFFKDAPEEIKSSILSTDSAHDLMLKRLNYELFQASSTCSTLNAFSVLLIVILSYLEICLHHSSCKRASCLNWLLLLISLVVVPVHVCSNAQTDVADASVLEKELCALREKLELQKKALQETIANRKKFLTSLLHTSKLSKSILACAASVRVLHTKKLKQHQLAELLPPPLYVIYSQLLAQKEAFAENIELEITGSVKDAQAFARQLANKDSATSLENSKIEDDVPDEEDDGQRRRKRPKKVPSKENLEQSGIYQSHPLKVTLHVNDDEASDLNSAKLITLKFEFLIKLNVVCVGVEGSEEPSQNNILCNLFPNDTGLELPQQSAKLRIGNSLSFDERRTSRPYKWAQHLAGIDVLPEVSPWFQPLKNQIVKLLNMLLSHRVCPYIVSKTECRQLCKGFAIGKRLSWLLQKIWRPQKRTGAPSLVATGVNDVNKLTPSKGSELEHSGRLSLISKSIISPITKGKSPSFKKQEDDVDLMLESENELDEPIQMEETSDNASPAMIENSWADSGIQEYSLVLIRKLDNDERIMKLEAKIKISWEYPLRPPHFGLSLYSLQGENNSEAICSEFLNELRAMEAEINVHLIRMIPFDQENLVLGHQVLCLAMLFDFFLDDGNPSSERTCTSVIDVGLCKPVSGGLNLNAEVGISLCCLLRVFASRAVEDFLHVSVDEKPAFLYFAWTLKIYASLMMSRYGLGCLGASPLVIICCLLLRSRPVLRDGGFWLEQGCAFRNYLDNVRDPVSNLLQQLMRMHDLQVDTVSNLSHIYMPYHSFRAGKGSKGQEI